MRILLALTHYGKTGGGDAKKLTDRDDSERRFFRRKQMGSMKKKLTPAKTPLPKFRSDEEAANYFRTHSVADVWGQLPESGPAKVSKALEKSIRQRHAAAKSPISIRLDPGQIVAAKKIGAAKSVTYQTQLRMWIAEGITRSKASVLTFSRLAH